MTLLLLLGHFDAVVLEFLDASVEHFGETRALRGLSAHGVGQIGELLDLRVLMCRDLLFRESALLVELQELGVVPAILAQLTVTQCEDAVDGTIEQGQVVADHEHRAAELFELVEEPALGRFVEVVCRFVQHHRLGLLVEDAHQVDAATLATRERTEIFEQQVLLEAESVGETRDLRLGLVASALRGTVPRAR